MKITVKSAPALMDGWTDVLVVSAKGSSVWR